MQQGKIILTQDWVAVMIIIPNKIAASRLHPLNSMRLHIFDRVLIISSASERFACLSQFQFTAS